ncbi:MAG: carbohydrate ABC transporter permease [Planctomycetota bacterium]
MPTAPPRARKPRDPAVYLTYGLLVFGALLLLVPFYWMLSNSLKTEAEASKIPPTLLPLASYAEFESGRFEVSVSEQDDDAGTVRIKIEAGDAALPPLELAEGEPAPPPDRAQPRIGDTFVVGQDEVVRGLTPRWDNYPQSLERMDFMNALANTTVITTLSVLGQIISSSLVGFGFARFRFRGRNFLFLLMLSTMMLPPQVSMIPLFIGFRNLGMIDTIWPLVLPMWLGTPFYVFMFRQFFSQVPEELVEAARIDGASNLMIYSRLMLPLSTPVIAIVAIYTFMFTWNDFLGPLIYLSAPEMRTLALALNAFNGQYGVSDVQMLMAASFVTMLPCIVLFFAAQRYFVDTGASSGLKG